MRTGIVVLEDYFWTNLVEGWDDQWLQDFLHIPFTIQVAIHMVQRCSVMGADATLHHYGSSAKGNVLFDRVVQQMLS